MSEVSFKMVKWLGAVRWRRSVEEVLAPRELTFMQWLVLHTTRNLIRATEDAVSQSDVAAHLDLHRATVSDAMIALDRKGLVDRGGAAEGPAWRIFLTRKGTALLLELDPLTDAASSNISGEPGLPTPGLN